MKQLLLSVLMTLCLVLVTVTSAQAQDVKPQVEYTRADGSRVVLYLDVEEGVNGEVRLTTSFRIPDDREITRRNFPTFSAGKASTIQVVAGLDDPDCKLSVSDPYPDLGDEVTITVEEVPDRGQIEYLVLTSTPTVPGWNGRVDADYYTFSVSRSTPQEHIYDSQCHFAGISGAAADVFKFVTVEWGAPPPNVPPVGVDDTYSVDEDATLTVNVTNGVLANDTDADDPHSVLSAQLGAAPSHGTLTLNANGSFTYAPDPGFVGVDMFQYRPFDGKQAGDLTDVSITVRAVNRPPVAVDDNMSTTAGVSVEKNLLANDSDPDGDPLSVISYTRSSANGSIEHLGSGLFRYTPNTGFWGNDSFTYTISDGNGGSDQATVRVTVAAPSGDMTCTASMPSTAQTGVPYSGHIACTQAIDHYDALDLPAGMNCSVSGSRLNCSWMPGSPGTFSWRFKLYDAHGRNDLAAGAIVVSTPTCAPPVIDLLSPEEDARFVLNHGQTSVQVPFSWEADPTSCADRYRLQVSTWADFRPGSIVHDAQYTSTSTTLTFDVRNAYHWRVAGIGSGGQGPWPVERTFGVATATDAEGNQVLPEDYVLEKNYPNPFNPTTTIRYALPEGGDVEVVVVDVLGRVVMRLPEGTKQAGWHSVQLDASALSSGTYLYQLSVDGTPRGAKRMTLLK